MGEGLTGGIRSQNELALEELKKLEEKGKKKKEAKRKRKK